MYTYGSKKYGGKKVKLININDLKNYTRSSPCFKLSVNTNRYYMNGDTLASLLGAMLECSYDDYTFNGFSNEIGKSTGGSHSHKSGYNGDFRYLRKDKSGGKLNLSYNKKVDDVEGWKELDIERQEKFNDALYGFGWKSMISQKYGTSGSKQLLKRCTEDKKKHQHYDHLHIQGYANDFIKIIKIYE
ncbi:hypothetical protein [uncultured Algibacter sp.]|uniref:hypothetical protein n=1 Tax=uncultured Algibacter sp. TaxID=298659 RepID=UPI0032169529